MRGVAMSALAFLICIVGLGCQSSTPPATQHAAAPPQRAVIVSGANIGNSIVVFVPSDDPAHPTMLCASGQPVCPECEAAAAKYFATGVLDPKCSRTGATRTVVTEIPSTHAIN